MEVLHYREGDALLIRRAGLGAEQVIEPRLGGQIQDASGVIGGGFANARAAPGGEADFGEALEDVVEDGRGVFPGFEADVGDPVVFHVAKVPPSAFIFRIRAHARCGGVGILAAFFEHGVVGAFRGGGNPGHEACSRVHPARMNVSVRCGSNA